MIEWGWYCPLDGDGNYVGTAEASIMPTIRHQVNVAKAAEAAGFDLILVPTSLVNTAYLEEQPRADAICASVAIALNTSRIRILQAFKIGEMHPALLAKYCVSLDELSGGRLCLNITSGSGNIETRYGETLPHDDRIGRTWEAIKILKSLWTQPVTNFSGKFHKLERAILEPKPTQRPYPPLYTVGQSELGREVSAAECDTHLMQCNTPDIIKEQIEDIKTRAARHGRSVKFGLRAQVVVRESEAEARTALSEILSRVDPRVVQARSAEYRATDSQEVARLIGEALDSQWIAPSIWNGMHAVKSGAGTVLAGSFDQVAERCQEFASIGITNFILSSYPHEDEALRVGHNLIPRVNALMGSRAKDASPVASIS